MRKASMSKPRIFLIAGGLLASALLASGCAAANQPGGGENEPSGKVIGMANPAAVYCHGLGYEMEKTESEAGEDADCLFADGSRCAQWDFLSGRCGAEFSYCETKGGTLEENGNVGTCRFPDGSSCGEFEYFNGECAPGDNPGTAEDTAEDEAWKTFTNAAYGYSFEVPASCYEGALLGACKQTPPEERPAECLCFVNGTDPQRVMFQNTTITEEGAALATLMVMSPDSDVFRPPEGAELAAYVAEQFGDQYPEGVPEAANMELGGEPAIRISIPDSPGVAAYEEIYCMHGRRLFLISLIDTEETDNMAIYAHMLASWRFSE